MSDKVLRIANLGKRFSLGHQRNGNLRQTFVQGVREWFRPDGRNNEEFWALKNFNLEVRRGDVVGIIGRNGAGKSTLLKILSRITHPTTGRFEIDGRVSSLLEVGTGFHGELTGRENIFLNGTILGMRRGEVRKRFDEIVAFSGVENFLDTPVKHYSSGMRVRLAFSVAAHLEPEVLIIDEVLAVGDADFQNKCLGKMNEVSKKEGRTVLFVSHNMAAVEALCTRGIVMHEGTVAHQGRVDEAVKKYLGSGQDVAMDTHPWIGAGMSIPKFDFDSDVVSMHSLNYEIILSSEQVNRVSELAILVYNHFEERVGIIDLRSEGLEQVSSLKREITIKGRIEAIPLIEGSYQIGLFVSSNIFRGDILRLRRLVVNSPRRDYVPYAPRHRGNVEFKTSFTVE